jgi:AraC-like DNA-binding protein
MPAQQLDARASKRHDDSSKWRAGIAGRPADMPERPPGRWGMTSDVLSDVLRAIRLTGAVYFDYELSSPWVAEAPPATEISKFVMPDSDRLIEYHVITGGSCWGNLLGEEPVRLREGDILVFPQGDPHVLSSYPGMRAEPDMSAFVQRGGPLPMVFETGGGGTDRARVVCGFLGCDDRPFNPLIASLPKMIHLSAASNPATAWLRPVLETAVNESRGARAGSENVLARLSELMFVQVVREHLESLPPDAVGWLAGLRDPVVGQALTALHRSPVQDWTIETLAREVGVSRSALAERFASTTGQPPMQYLANWRMQLASRLLLDGGAVADVATAVGYDSEAAFSRGFKRIVGVPPSEWRRKRHPAAQ